MGADLILISVGEKDGPGEGENHTGFNNLKQYINNLKKKDIVELAKKIATECDGIEYEGEDDKDLKDSMLANIDEFISGLDSRDVGGILHKGDMLYVTGGMSWGDDPTDSYAEFEKVRHIIDCLPEGAAEKLGVW